MPVYQSRRDFRFPDAVCEITKENAAKAELVDDGEGILAYGRHRLPFPKTGLELLWTSSVFTYRPFTEGN